MIYTKDDIAKTVFQKATGRANDIDLLQVDDNAVQVFNTQYPLVLGFAMQMRNWSWTNRFEAINLERLVETSDARYPWKIKEPEHLKVLKGVFLDDRGDYKVDYKHHDRYIHINFQDNENPCVVYMSYVSEPAEAIMPDYFVWWFVHFMAWNITMDVSGDTTRYAMLKSLHEDLLKIAQAADNKENGKQKIPTNVFVSVRN